jgi:hypothetical protein
MKYELIEECGLLRLMSLKDFANVKKGDKGGLVSCDKNLSQDGNALVSGDARVIVIDFISKYRVTVTDNHLKIGCQQHTFAEWRGFSDYAISQMDDDALEWWRAHKEFIFNAIDLRK